MCGFAVQYSVMPTLGYLVSRVLGLSPAFSVGLILLGSCPGGQASNLATYVANGDVALSVLMTAASTLCATFMTPLLCSVLAGQLVPVNAWSLAKSTIQLVFLPTVLGVIINEIAPKPVDVIRPIMPMLSLAITIFLCAVPVAQVAPILRYGR